MQQAMQANEKVRQANERTKEYRRVKARQAYERTRELKIPDEKTKPVLRQLLKESGENWDYIELENYSALIDAIYNADEGMQIEGSSNGNRGNDPIVIDTPPSMKKNYETRSATSGSSNGNREHVVVTDGPRPLKKNYETRSTASGSSTQVVRKQPPTSGSSTQVFRKQPPTSGTSTQVVQKQPLTSSSSTQVVQKQPQASNGDRKRKYKNRISDITKGSESVEISLVDDVGNEELPKFTYIPHNITYQDAIVRVSLARISDEDCCADCKGNCLSADVSCACASETGGEYAYTKEGLLKKEFLDKCLKMKKEPDSFEKYYCEDCPLEKGTDAKCDGHLIRKFIKECWRKCGCNMLCGNRIVQRGIKCGLQVYFTQEGKGWGLRTLQDLPKGTFVCEYIGEILTNTELYHRNINFSSERHTYPVTLDADWGSERDLKDEEALCLDATLCGNVARFINHRCDDANLIDIPVSIETPDKHYYHIAFFTIRDVKAMDELTWDYMIDFSDESHPVKAFRCCCGSESCRDKKTIVSGSKGKSVERRRIVVPAKKQPGPKPVSLRRK